ncbi:hypothetical protein B0T25DRAFT_134725 [Lasiosphaeria hispida]|uniref:C2H2-type domain-containing protein n=1 Tax=Lasiosphaeria hispida TaxID=260671 RepID=A0AAJ0HKP5_9PEZI|nr:hypothetical protein B0T25DRAFT_134725 [Lasiosphaeria hispida]
MAVLFPPHWATSPSSSAATSHQVCVYLTLVNALVNTLINILTFLAFFHPLFILRNGTSHISDLLPFDGRLYVSLRPATGSRQDRRARGATNRFEPYKLPSSPGAQGNAGKSDGRRRQPREDNDRPSNLKVKRRKSAPAGGRYFACPFYKFNPILHRHCVTHHQLGSPSYVVQHIRRDHHMQPIHCPTCGETFGTRTDCNNHTNERRCSPQPFSHEGITEDQRNRLIDSTDRRRRLLDDNARWFDIWDELFPLAQRPDSAYVDGEEQELLDVFRRAVRIARELGLVDFFGHDYFGGLDTFPKWDIIRGIQWPSSSDLSFLSSDNRFPQNASAPPPSFSWGLRIPSPSDMLPQPGSPPAMNSWLGDTDCEQPFETPSLLGDGTSHMSSSQPLLSIRLETKTHMSDDSARLEPRLQQSEDPPMPEMQILDHDPNPDLNFWDAGKEIYHPPSGP